MKYKTFHADLSGSQLLLVPKHAHDECAGSMLPVKRCSVRPQRGLVGGALPTDVRRAAAAVAVTLSRQGAPAAKLHRWERTGLYRWEHGICVGDWQAERCRVRGEDGWGGSHRSG